MGRTILGMLLGVVTMMFTIYAVESIGHLLYPPPAGLDPSVERRPLRFRGP